MSPIYLADAIYRVIDTETTDREPTQAKVVEVAWIDVDAAGTEHGRFQTLIDPGVPIPPSSSAVHHIVDADVVGAPPLDSFLEQMRAEVYVAHNAEYDRTVLGITDARWICTHRLSKHLWPHIGNHSNQEVRYTLGLKPRIDRDAPAHRALNDAAVTASILAAALPLVPTKWPKVRTVDDLIREISTPCLIERVPFKSSGNVRFEDADTGLLEWIVEKGAGGEDCVHTAIHWLQQRRGYDDDVVDAEFWP